MKAPRIMVATRPDVCYTVTRLSQDLAKPNSFHLMKAKHVLRYLKDTINQLLIFKKLQNDGVLGSAEYFFIGIAPRSILAQSGIT